MLSQSGDPSPYLTNHHIGPAESTTVGQATPRCGGGLINELLQVMISHSGDPSPTYGGLGHLTP